MSLSDLSSRCEGVPSPTTATATGRLVSEATRYLLVAVVALATDFSTLVVLREWIGWHYLPSAAMAFTFGLLTNYFLSIAWVFSSRAIRSPLLEFVLFTSIGLIGLVLTEVILWFGTDYLGMDYRLSKLIAVGSVFVWNFGARKLLLFRRRGA